MDPSWSTLVNIITELQQEKRDVKMAFEKRVADLELELRIEQQRNSALMTQLIEAILKAIFKVIFKAVFKAILKTLG
ncbi:hypothetical protein EG327_002921 [Venturia inaequalis]|uniref:Uncharacterized protein n=1 Tax=Venturia inaequalis TaxID=5025 RepID=A0A8H3VKC1_VENIN|nr:hypothetical protein EG327_002921 [Venturia inaequalis]